MLSLKRWLDRSRFGAFLEFMSKRGWLGYSRLKSDSIGLRCSASLGELGELQAERFLKKLGYRIIAHGHRQRLGEIDLIALDGSTIVFVEVKTWATDSDCDPSVAVNAVKQQRITRTALTYMKRKRLLNQPCRFDVISIVWNGSPETNPRIRHFQSAFEAVGHGQFYC